MFVAALGLILSATVMAASKSSTSGRSFATFLYCSEFFCVPIGYWGEGTVTTTFTPSGTTMRISRIEQTMSLYYASNNPCGIGVAIDTQIFRDRGAALVATIPVYTRGTYWISPTTLFYGGYSNIDISVPNPRLRGRGFASVGPGSSCLGWKSFNWDFDLP
jgi:hypothetical protein